MTAIKNVSNLTVASLNVGTAYQLLAENNISVTGLSADEVQAKAKELLSQPVGNSVAIAYNSNKVKRGGNQHSFNSKTVWLKFGAKDASEFVTKLQATSNTFKLLVCDLVDFKNLPQTLKATLLPSEKDANAIRYEAEITSKIGSEVIVFMVKTVTFANQFTDRLNEMGGFSLGSELEISGNYYNINGREIVGLCEKSDEIAI